MTTSTPAAFNKNKAQFFEGFDALLSVKIILPHFDF